MSRVAEILARLERDPDESLWLELARRVERGEALDREAARSLLEGVTRALGRHPAEPGLHRAWAAATGFALADPGAVPHGAWWSAAGRLGDGGDHAYDTVTGMPLAIRPTVARAQFLWVPPGRFLMGTSEDELPPWSDQGPQHQVVLERGFYLQRFPLVIAEEGTMFSETDLYDDGPGSPCHGLSWDACQEFVIELTTLEWGEGGLPPSWEYRLPTEFEDVGQKLPNPWGFHDMLGLVMEWCEDRHHTSYQGAPEDGSAWIEPPGPEPTARVCRGGNLYSPAGGCTAAYRNPMDQSTAVMSGCRLVLAPVGQEAPAGAQSPR